MQISNTIVINETETLAFLIMGFGNAAGIGIHDISYLAPLLSGREPTEEEVLAAPIKLEIIFKDPASVERLIGSLQQVHQLLKGKDNGNVSILSPHTLKPIKSPFTPS